MVGSISHLVARVMLPVIMAAVLSPSWTLGWGTTHERMDHPASELQLPGQAHHHEGKASHDYADTHSVSPSMGASSVPGLALTLASAAPPSSPPLQFSQAYFPLPLRPPR